jgi:hypothetical protein
MPSTTTADHQQSMKGTWVCSPQGWKPSHQSSIYTDEEMAAAVLCSLSGNKEPLLFSIFNLRNKEE